jgi:hypothetical protein
MAEDTEKALEEILQLEIPMEDWTSLEEEIEQAHFKDLEDLRWLPPT